MTKFKKNFFEPVEKCLASLACSVLLQTRLVAPDTFVK